jgi:SAM-dependent methyltransferase
MSKARVAKLRCGAESRTRCGRVGEAMSIRRFVRVHLLRRLKQVLQRREIAAYFSGSAVPKINVGCGSNIQPGWLNADLFPRPGCVYMDAGQRWPVADDAFELLLCEHMIEHVPKPLARRLLKEAFRTLKPGGKVRFVTPDLAMFSRLLLDPAERAGGQPYLDLIRTFFSQPEASWCDAFNYCFYEHGHRYIYSPEELRAELSAVGFANIVETRAGVPSDPDFLGIEGHVKVIGAEPDAIEAFGLEASKPLN